MSAAPERPAIIAQRKINTHFEYPPIPIREFDWCATYDGYEPGDPIGWGATREDAIADLTEWDEENDGE